MYNLIVDAGNSSIKMFVFSDGEIIKYVKCHKIEELMPALADLSLSQQISRCIISSVSVDSRKIADAFGSAFPVLIFDKSTNIPINIRYKTPETLGSDRVAAVVGAVSRFPKRNILVIDSGTAITYDIVTENGDYLGGNISVGLKSRFRALHNFTEKLPLLMVDKSLDSLYGSNTTEALTIGVQNGMIYEVEGFIKAFSEKFDNLLVVFTGGDSFFFDIKINFCTFAEPNLVALGLNEILEYNV